MGVGGEEGCVGAVELNTLKRLKGGQMGSSICLVLALRRFVEVSALRGWV